MKYKLILRTVDGNYIEGDAETLDEAELREVREALPRMFDGEVYVMTVKYKGVANYVNPANVISAAVVEVDGS